MEKPLKMCIPYSSQIVIRSVGGLNSTYHFLSLKAGFIGCGIRST